MYGRTYLGNERTTFVIDSGGEITDVFRKVKPAEHDDKVLARCRPRSAIRVAATPSAITRRRRAALPLLPLARV